MSVLRHHWPGFPLLVVVLGNACFACTATRDLSAPPKVRPSSRSSKEQLDVVSRSSAVATSASARIERTPSNPPALDLETFREPPVVYPFHGERGSGSLERRESTRRIANLSPAQCRQELKRRNLPVERASGPAAGIANPLRIAGALRGVRFVAPGKRSIYGKLDCRLVLALDELSELLREHGVVSVRIDNFYRPKARLPGRRSKSQHAYGLAADLVEFELENGTTLNVERDFQGRLGEPVCGPDASLVEVSEASIALRNLVCDIARQGYFHHILTPNFNTAHEDHFHFDIKRDTRHHVVE